MKFDFQIAIDQPEQFTFAAKGKANIQAILRPLKTDDEENLSSFLILINLSAATRNFYTLSSYNELKAREIYNQKAGFKLKGNFQNDNGQKVYDMITEVKLDSLA